MDFISSYLQNSPAFPAEHSCFPSLRGLIMLSRHWVLRQTRRGKRGRDAFTAASSSPHLGDRRSPYLPLLHFPVGFHKGDNWDHKGQNIRHLHRHTHPWLILSGWLTDPTVYVPQFSFSLRAAQLLSVSVDISAKAKFSSLGLCIPPPHLDVSIRLLAYFL